MAEKPSRGNTHPSVQMKIRHIALMHSWKQFWYWWETGFLKILYPWTWNDTWQNHDPDLWDIPTKLCCLMVLFLIQCEVSRLHRAFRVATLVLLVLYSAFTDGEHVPSSRIGMVMAQVQIVIQDRANTSSLHSFDVVKDIEGSTRLRRDYLIPSFARGV